MTAAVGRTDAPAGRMTAAVGRTDAPAGRMTESIRRTDAPGARMTTAVGRTDAPGGRMTETVGRTDAPGGRMTEGIRRTDAPGGRMTEGIRRTDAPGGRMTAAVLRACAPVRPAPPSAPVVPEPPSDPTAADPSSDTSLPTNDAAPSSGRAVAAFVDEPPPPSGVSVNPVKTALLEFLASRERKKGRDYIKGVIIRKLGQDIEPDLLDDLAQYAMHEALEARSPPWTVGGIPGWVGRVTRRQIAHYFQARQDDQENLDPDAHAHDPSDRHAPQTDWGAREQLICKWLEKEIGPDPRRRETFKLILEHEIADKSLKELAIEHRTTERAIANRIHKLRKELAPKVALMDEEKPRRFVLLALFGLGFAAVLFVLYLLLQPLLSPARPPPPAMVPAPVPTLSAAPLPVFDQALPTTPDAGPKPQDIKP